MIFLHISNGSEIQLMSILKLFVDTFVSFLKREVIIISLLIENIVVLDFLNDYPKKEKNGSMK